MSSMSAVSASDPPAKAESKVDGRVSRARRLRESRRAAVLAVARRIFSKKGYHDTSIHQIIEAAAIARGTFYLYFESKRAIFDELLGDLFKTLQAQVRRIEVGPGAPAPIDQMHDTVDRVLQTLLDNREMARILLREAVGLDSDFDRKLADFYGRIEAMLVGALETGRQLGVVRPCDPNVVARCILGSIKEVVQWAFVEQDPMKIDLPRVGREMITHTLRGCFSDAAR
jgi:AcrR family transcriptional regulator